MNTHCPTCESPDTRAVQARPGTNPRFARTSRPEPNRLAFVLGVLLVLGVLPAVLLVSAFAGTTAGGAVLLLQGAAGVALLVAYFASRRGLGERQAKWKTRAEYVRRAWVCNRCGVDWIPQD